MAFFKCPRAIWIVFSVFIIIYVLQAQLDETMKVWNSHVIRPSKNHNVPSGRPTVMYLMPELYSTENFLSSVDEDDLQLCKSTCTFRSTVQCDYDVYELCNIIMAESQMVLPYNSIQALDLYIHLRNEIKVLL